MLRNDFDDMGTLLHEPVSEARVEKDSLDWATAWSGDIASVCN